MICIENKNFRRDRDRRVGEPAANARLEDIELFALKQFCSENAGWPAARQWRCFQHR